MRRRTVFTSAMSGWVAAAAAPGALRAEATSDPALTEIQALLKAHDQATTSHDMAGVLACLTENPVVMGTGPGEMWSGPEEIKIAYQHFFEGYDRGKQDFEYHFNVGSVGSDMGWLMASGNIKGKKDGKDFTYPLNVSVTVAKTEGNWRIASMHFSTLTSGGEVAQE